MKSGKVKWGVLGAANIARRKVIPAMQPATSCEIAAIASRDWQGAGGGRRLGIPKAYGSYEEMLADPEIEAVYNPLPNHLHVPWSVTRGRGGQARALREAAGSGRRRSPQLLAARRAVPG